MSEQKFYEMLWDCQFCGTKGNLGLTHRFCPNCGAPQNPDARYYPSDEQKVAVQDHRYVGVDVICPNCSELNSAEAEYCGQCGTPLTEAARARTLSAQSRSKNEIFESSGSRDITKERFDRQMQAIGVQPDTREKQKRGGMNMGCFILLGIAALVAVGVFIAFNWTSDAQFTVVERQWERTIDVQQYTDFRVNTWRDSRPAGDDVQLVFGSCREQQRGTRRIPDGETCRTVRTDNGDGTFSERQQCTTNYRNEPVYDDMCTWTGYNWQNTTPLSANNQISSSLIWPQASFTECSALRVGCLREAGRSESYFIIYRNNADESLHTCEYSLGRWTEIEEQSRWVGKVRQLGGSLVCDSLQPTN